MIVKEVSIRRIMSSAGTPTVEIGVKTDSSYGRASVPTGTSTGKHEVKPFAKDVGSSMGRFKRDVVPEVVGRELNGLNNVLEIERVLMKHVPETGGNPILCLSYALLRCLNKDVYKVLARGRQDLSVPKQVCNVVGGGKHGKGTEFQEFHVIPMTENYPESMEASWEVHKRVGKELGSKRVGLEGAWTSGLGNIASLEVLRKVADSVSDERGIEIGLGLDVAASEFFDRESYIYKDRKLSREEQIEFMAEVADRFGLAYLEDPLDQDDFKGFEDLQKRVDCIVVGDDLFATNTSRLRPVCRGAIVKPNQVGALHRTIDFIGSLKENDMVPTVSHRSQETEDPILADLAVGLDAPYIKVSVYGSERISKMKRLEQIYSAIRGRS